MKRIFSTAVDSKLTDLVLLVLRLIGGSFMLSGHGIGKLQKLTSGQEIEFADPFGIGPTASFALAVFAEFFCSFLLILGFGTRLAVIPLIVTMSVAAFIAHADDPFGKKELALVYLTIYIALFALGSGKISVDQLISKRLK
jgi:putative oxidoreductase